MEYDECFFFFQNSISCQFHVSCFISFQFSNNKSEVKPRPLYDDATKPLITIITALDAWSRV